MYVGGNNFHHRDSDVDIQIHKRLHPKNTGENFVHNLSHHCTVQKKKPEMHTAPTSLTLEHNPRKPHVSRLP